MELDKRIKEGKRPLTCFDIEEGKHYLGKECYFANADAAFSNLDDIAWLRKGMLTGVFEESEYPFCSHGVRSLIEARQIVPCEWVKEEKKEPKYRPYSLEEFIGDVNLGLEPWITMRPVGTNKECKFLYTGYQETEVGEYICLGCFQFDFVSLFQNYEICISGEWQPFGVIDESQE